MPWNNISYHSAKVGTPRMVIIKYFYGLLTWFNKAQRVYLPSTEEALLNAGFFPCTRPFKSLSYKGGQVTVSWSFVDFSSNIWVSCAPLADAYAFLWA